MTNMAHAFLVHVSASLDAASYIISMGLVDLLMFGRPLRIQSDSDDDQKRMTYGPSAVDECKPRRTASDPGRQSRFGLVNDFYDAPFVQPDDTGRAYPFQDSRQERRSGSLDDYVGSQKIAYTRNRPRRTSSHVGGVHHHQGKLFSKQVSTW